jgi:hypothetical protein
LLADAQTILLPPGSLEPLPETHTLTGEKIASERGVKVFHPITTLPLGVNYQWMYRRGARLHLVTLDLRKNQDLHFFPYVTGAYNVRSGGSEKVREVAKLGLRTGALVALNGPFFIPTGRHLGKPLGSLIADGKLLFDLDDPYVLQMNRTFLAWTSAGRFVFGETDLTGQKVLAENQADSFARESLASGERILSLVGGLGIVARGGDPEVWRKYAGHQFGAHYYGRHTRRPQSFLGLADNGHKLLILVQEGFPHSERRFTVPELGHLLVHLGADEVAFTDGGGSADLFLAGREVVRTENGGAHRRNSCILVIRERSNL